MNKLGLTGPLIITDEHIRQAKGNKAVGFVPILPLHFIQLTSFSRREEIQLLSGQSRALNLEDYNRFALEGENIIPPFLKVNIKTGEVMGHEGKHRATAAYREDPYDPIWVAIILANEEGNHLPPYGDTPTSIRDIPSNFIGQVRPAYLSIKIRKAVGINGERYRERGMFY